MSQVKQFTTQIAGRDLTVEVGKLAPQAQAACTVRYGDTVILATVVAATEPREGIDYFPLMVDFEERLYAAGKIKGSRFIKREGRASDEAVLTARLIDRSIRPLFRESMRKDVQVVLTALCVDNINDSDIPATIATSIALAISPIPWSGPIAGVRVGRINGEWVLNATFEARLKSDFELMVTGNADGIIMIEAEGNQIAEDVMYEAIEFAHKHIKQQLKFIEDVVKQIGQPKREEALDEETKTLNDLVEKKVKAFLANKDLTQLFNADKSKMKAAITAAKDELDDALKADNEVSKDARVKGNGYFDIALDAAARDLVFKHNRRVDGRGMDEVRPLAAEVGLLPRTHGSGLFNRGETQVLSIVTLGSPGDEQLLDTMEESGKKRYMHHYNFPGFATGEVKPIRMPSRREIGHGALAEKALEKVLPSKEDFPYTIRVVSEVLASNGSSSQASICGSTLALMDAGVPITAPVAGIAMGLVTNPADHKDYKILTDIQGIEDHSFDMDFKVAGTATGITAIQMDIKLGFIPLQVAKETLESARVARMKVLDVMAGAIAAPRPELSQYAPRIISLRIDPDKIRDVIGSGGKIINQIIDECGVQIDIEDDGLVMITSVSAEGGQKAKQWVEDLTRDMEIGEIVEGTVTKIVTDKMNGNEIGAIVEFGHGRDGMVHISEFRHERIARVSDIVKVGDTLKVKVVDVDKEKGRTSLSVKALLPFEPRTGEDMNSYERKPRFNGPRKPFSRRDH
ncbi:MAG: polyribonucleotide nucleotidyltransferase [Candidatus Komeilibacteria bacterium]